MQTHPTNAAEMASRSGIRAAEAPTRPTNAAEMRAETSTRPMNAAETASRSGIRAAEAPTRPTNAAEMRAETSTHPMNAAEMASRSGIRAAEAPTHPTNAAEMASRLGMGANPAETSACSMQPPARPAWLPHPLPRQLRPSPSLASHRRVPRVSSALLQEQRGRG